MLRNVGTMSLKELMMVKPFVIKLVLEPFVRETMGVGKPLLAGAALIIKSSTTIAHSGARLESRQAVFAAAGHFGSRLLRFLAMQASLALTMPR
jgi:hypothetical protein